MMVVDAVICIEMSSRFTELPEDAIMKEHEAHPVMSPNETSRFKPRSKGSS